MNIRLFRSSCSEPILGDEIGLSIGTQRYGIVKEEPTVANWLLVSIEEVSSDSTWIRRGSASV